MARLARDKDSKVRGAALDAIKSLVDVALIAPFLPIVKEMMDDPSKEVSSDACVLYRQLKEYECSFKKDGVTEDVARRRFFENGLVQSYIEKMNVRANHSRTDASYRGNEV